MSALRISVPGRAPGFVDLGPLAAVPLHGHSHRGHPVSGGRRVVPDAAPDPSVRRDAMRLAQQRYRARKAGAA